MNAIHTEIRPHKPHHTTDWNTDRKTLYSISFSIYSDMTVSIHPSRYRVLRQEFEQAYFAQIKESLLGEKSQGKTIYPRWPDIFKAFDLTPFDSVKVVILGQDPYHGIGQAMGLSFSVPVWVTLPPSLKNIYKELQEEYPEYDSKQSWDLTRRATQWVLLLNSILTVRAGEPASHNKIWRQEFTDTVITQLSTQREGIVFLLRWAYAQSKVPLLLEGGEAGKHLILQSVHPSPLSAHRGRFWCNHFRLANEYLQKTGKEEIQW
jgi:uracil-DNA glycosylase